MGNMLWFVWFFVSRKVVCLSILGIWIFTGLYCLVGLPGRPKPPASWAVYWVLGTAAAIPIVVWYTFYNIRVFVRKTGQSTRRVARVLETEWRRD